MINCDIAIPGFFVLWNIGEGIFKNVTFMVYFHEYKSNKFMLELKKFREAQRKKIDPS